MSATRETTTAAVAAVEETPTNEYQATIAVQITTRAADIAEAHNKFVALGRDLVRPHVTNGFNGSLDQWDVIRFRDMQIDGRRAARREHTVLVAYGVSAPSVGTAECAASEIAGLTSYGSQVADREAAAIAAAAPSRSAAVAEVERAVETTAKERGRHMNQGVITGYTILPQPER